MKHLKVISFPSHQWDNLIPFLGQNKIFFQVPWDLQVLVDSSFVVKPIGFPGQRVFLYTLTLHFKLNAFCLFKEA